MLTNPAFVAKFAVLIQFQSGAGLHFAACRGDLYAKNNCLTTNPTTPAAQTDGLICLLILDHAALAHAQQRAGALNLPVRWLGSKDDPPQNATLVKVAARCLLPNRWLERLLTASANAPDHVLAPFCDVLKPLRAGSHLVGSASDIDALLYAFSPTNCYSADFTDAPVVLIPAAQRRAFAAGTATRTALYGGMFVASAHELDLASSAPTEPELPWYGLCDQLKTALDAGQRSSLLQDSRPRLLHALHSWGGGVERFARDYAAADTRYRHLWLLPTGVHASARFGTELKLLDPTDALELYRAPITPAIAALSSLHAGYSSILAQLQSCYRINVLLVSSLIGHSLDVLKTGLPTALVLHDYFPIWPKLHCDFGDLQRRFDSAELALDARHTEPFASQTPASWASLRAEYEAALLAANVTLIAPSQSALGNFTRLAPALAQLPAHVIGHGLAPWPRLFATPLADAKKRSARTDAKLSVLVPGRIAGGKGGELLLQCLPQLLEHADLILLGPATGALAFYAQAGIDVIPDYRMQDLPQLIAQLAPDLALLPRTVAETFSYSLSEMRSLGVPVLATQTGALAERITEGVDGFLCAAGPASLIEALRALRLKPERLAVVRAQLAARAEPTPAQQAQLYTQVWSGIHARGKILPVAMLDLNQATAVALLQSNTSRVRAELTMAHARFSALQTEAIKRGEWGRKTTELLAERTQWAQSLVAQVDALMLQASAQNAAHIADLEHLKNLITGLQDQLAQSETQQAKSEAGFHQLANAHAALDQELALAREDYRQILQSSSWKLTRPLRVLMRATHAFVNRLSFQLRRAKTRVRRGLSSLRTRGLTATWARLWRTDSPLLHPVTLLLPDVPKQFSAYLVNGTVLPDHLATAVVDVSIIIPVYNKFHYTDTCLRSLSANVSTLRVEIIVVDDCSTDETWENLNEISGIRALKNVQNLGFIGACNAGAAAANGHFLVFLNNDTAVQAGWLDALITSFSARADAGLVGAQLVYPDGRLQESGGIIFSDGSGWNYGRFADPNDPQYGFVREVDYCSGAAIALRKSLFDQFGGFDTLYTPAYYEDTDLAFKVRQAGLKCYVQPSSRVVHFEGISSGTDLSTGIKRYQVINQQKFLARWSEVLKSHPAPPPKTPIAIASQHRAAKFVLIVDAVTPMPDQDSGSLRMINLLTILVNAGCAVTFFCEGRHYHAGYAEKLQALGVQVLYHPYLSSEPTWLAENGARFDAVLLSRHYIAAPLIGLVREHCRRARLIFDTVDLHFLREQRQAELAGDLTLAKAALKTRAAELAVIAACDLTLVVSPIEQALLKEIAPLARVEILSNIHDVPGCANDFAARSGMLFVGGFQHPPNVDAALWFVREVLPLARAALPAELLPEFVLHLVGSNTPPEIAALACDFVVVHGFVADIDPLLASARLSIAPLRYGAGVKGKVNMAMAHGLPVIATGAAVEGMHCSDGLDVLIGDSPAAFATALVRAYQDAALWQRLSTGGLANVSTHFSFAAATGVIARIFMLDSPAKSRASDTADKSPLADTPEN